MMDRCVLAGMVLGTAFGVGSFATQGASAQPQSVEGRFEALAEGYWGDGNESCAYQFNAKGSSYYRTMANCRFLSIDLSTQTGAFTVQAECWLNWQEPEPTTQVFRFDGDTLVINDEAPLYRCEPDWL